MAVTGANAKLYAQQGGITQPLVRLYHKNAQNVPAFDKNVYQVVPVSVEARQRICDLSLSAAARYPIQRKL